MKNLFKKYSAKFVQNPSSFTKVMAKHILVCFFMPHSVYALRLQVNTTLFHHIVFSSLYEKLIIQYVGFLSCLPVYTACGTVMPLRCQC